MACRTDETLGRHAFMFGYKANHGTGTRRFGSIVTINRHVSGGCVTKMSEAETETLVINPEGGAHAITKGGTCGKHGQ